GSRAVDFGGEGGEVAYLADEVGLLDDDAGYVVAQLGGVADGGVALDDLDAVAGGEGADDGLVLGVDAGRHQDSVALGDGGSHDGGLAEGGAGIVHGGVGDVHAGKLAD